MLCMLYYFSYTNLYRYCSALQQQVKPCLEKLRQDTDIDVQYFAQEALEGKLWLASHPKEGVFLKQLSLAKQ